MSEYIERAAVKDEILFWAVCINHPELLSKEDTMHCIDNMPSADVAPVRHGRWIEDERTYPGPGLANNLCSVCGEIAGAWKEGLAPERKWAYCPACGALMDGKEDEHEAD